MRGIQFLHLAILLLCSTICYAANPIKIKWGKVSEHEINLKTCEFDSLADAVILNESGRMYFVGSRANIEVTRRIKILSDNGIPQANITIPYYSYEGIENITKVEAHTINMDGRKASIINVDKKDIFDVEVDPFRNELRFAFPGVRVGSIIEYKYRLSTSRIHVLNSWVFQHDIPTVHSYVKVEFPEYLVYSVIYKGPLLYSKYATKKINNVSEWYLSDIPGYVREPFVYNYEDYADKLIFQLYRAKVMSGKNTPNQSIEWIDVITSWKKVGNDFYDNYKQFFNREALLNTIVSLEDQNLTELEKIEQLYKKVQNNFQWEHIYSKYPSKPIRALVKDGSGYTSDINLLLISLLLNYDIEAYPVLISTRSNGQIVTKYPIIDQFNNLIAGVKMKNGSWIFIDAATTSRKANFQVMNIANLTESGLLIKKDESEIIRLTQNGRNGIVRSYKLSFTKDSLKLNYQQICNGYDAFEMQRESSPDQSNDLMEHITGGLGIYELENTEPAYKGIKTSSRVTSVELDCFSAYHLDQSTSFISILELSYFQNPFKDPQRHNPIELEYDYSNGFIVDIEVPEGYKILEDFKNNQFVNPDKSVTFRIAVDRKAENKMSLLARWSVKKRTFSKREYKSLKVIFDEIYNVLDKKIVIEPAA